MSSKRSKDNVEQAVSLSGSSDVFIRLSVTVINPDPKLAIQMEDDNLLLPETHRH